MGSPVGASVIGVPVGDAVTVLVGTALIDGLEEGIIVVGATDTGGFVGVPQLSIQMDCKLQ